MGLILFQFIGDRTRQFLDFSDAGAKFVFGEGFEEHLIAFKVLPTIIFFSSFISLLYYHQILPKVVGGLGWIMMRILKTSGAESLSCAANIFVGQTQAPLLIKPYLSNLTMSELHAVMTGGFATIAGGVMSAYIAFRIPAEHLIAASVMAKIFYSETAKPQTYGKLKLEIPQVYTNSIDAITTGALDGLKLALNLGAMLIAFLALLALVNTVLGWLGGQLGFPQLSL
ncbi:Na+-dependent nucleoside transporter [Chondrocystis sp. NIES-4102]|nr:Na+-dependent nucleoside transporter [Chondrocystis sp. NIES-4102]